MKTHLLNFLLLFFIGVNLQAQVSSIGIIGSATPGGWDNETLLTQVDDSLWTITIFLNDGEAKFRANNSWDVNWGAREFPKGTGTQNGPNIPIIAGDYEITFNANTGDYFFDVDSDISIIGSATTGDDTGWNTDIKMYRNQLDTNKYFLVADLYEGALKFRTTGSWDTNWGSTDFPSGVGVQNGDNIPIAQTSKYEIIFDKSTGEYAFTEKVEYTLIGIIGSATPGGWDEESPLTRSSSNPNLWRTVLVLNDGEVKFRANGGWDVDWGGTSFPSGTGILKGDNITVTPGEYIITFNTSDFEYNFLEVIEYQKMQLMGSATPGGWDNGVVMNQDPEDKTLWKLRVKLTDGEAKFRANEDWNISWGADSFPNGIGETDNGPNIPVVAGDYFVDFNSTTGVYSFRAVIEYDKVSIVGKSGPAGDWPGDDDSRDTYLNKDAEDFNLWTLPSITLTNYSDVSDGGIKFRANASWSINWGATSFPEGKGTQNGPNIEPVAGTYSVVFRSDTGDYLFGEPSSTTNLYDPALITVYPNPALNTLTVTLDNEIFYGTASFTIYDMTGRMVSSSYRELEKQNSIDLSNMQSGKYILQIKNDKFLIGKSIVILK